MTIDISDRNLELISAALATQIRLLDSYINPDRDLLLKLAAFKCLKDDIDEIRLRQ